jgi:hypothetical protein
MCPMDLLFKLLYIFPKQILILTRDWHVEKQDVSDNHLDQSDKRMRLDQTHVVFDKLVTGN